jgi:hypothetical protein
MRPDHSTAAARGLLVLALLALAAAPLAGPRGAHCAHQGADGGAGTVVHSPTHHPVESPPEDSPAREECPHCPIEQCATQVACSVQLAEAGSPDRVDQSPPVSADPVLPRSVAMISRTLPPPTPPPQLAA